MNVLLQIGGDALVARKKPGPKPENPKDTMLRVRVDKITLDKLDDTAKKLATTRSEVIRKGIDMIHSAHEK
jgi:hypothetical protein